MRVTFGEFLALPGGVWHPGKKFLTTIKSINRFEVVILFKCVCGEFCELFTVRGGYKLLNYC